MSDARPTATFPNNGADAVLHLTTGALFAAVAAIQLGLDRRTEH
jgi:hypothetical protein